MNGISSRQCPRPWLCSERDSSTVRRGGCIQSLRYMRAPLLGNASRPSEVDWLAFKGFIDAIIQRQGAPQFMIIGGHKKTPRGERGVHRVRAWSAAIQDFEDVMGITKRSILFR